MRILYVLVLLVVAPLAGAESVTYESLMDSIEEALQTRTDTGVIQEIDLGERTILVSGFQYFLGPPTETPPLSVKMLGRDYGSLQMLTVGMHVEIEYVDVNNYRVGFSIQEIDQADQS